MAQASSARRPVLVPAWTVRPMRSRATTLTSTPCQFSMASPKLVDVLRELVDLPDLARNQVVQPADDVAAAAR